MIAVVHAVGGSFITQVFGLVVERDCVRDLLWELRMLSREHGVPVKPVWA